ncbi:MAG: hypothetical protein ACK4P3_03130 [Fimbriimonadaceae bacterium]
MKKIILSLISLGALSMAFLSVSGCAPQDEADMAPVPEASGDFGGDADVPKTTDAPTETAAPAMGGPGVNPPPPMPGEGE